MFHPVIHAIMSFATWCWQNPQMAGFGLATLASLFLIWLHVPTSLRYYFQDNGITIHPVNVRNEIPGDISGRIAVLLFCRKHIQQLWIGRRVRESLVEFFLTVMFLPNPRLCAWDGAFAAIMVYPLGRSRFEYLGICRKRRMWPWKQVSTLKGILDANNGYLPGFENETFFSALIGRIREA